MAEIESDTKTYDEALYPRPASESDEDSEQSMADSEQSMVDSTEEHTSVNMEESDNEKAIIDDFTCIICAQALVDPMTLHCGHSFCQLCLAGVWASKRRAHPLYLQCPVCRQSWKNFPAINIQLRNITERNYPRKVESRRAAMTPEHLALVQQFTNVKQAEYQANSNNRQRLQPEIRRIVNTLLFCFAIIIVLLIVVFCLLLWVWAGAGGEFMRKPVGKWSNEDVVQWMDGLGEWTQHNYSSIFRKEKITGPQLLLLNEKALTMLGVDIEFRRQTILQAVQELRVREFSAPRNFPEFKAAHRKETLLVTLLYKEWPRLTFLYTYFFCYYDVFLPLLKFHFPPAEGGEEADVEGIWEEEGVGGERGVQREKENNDAETLVQAEPTLRQLFAFVLEVLLIPHYLVAGYAWSWFSLHPWICLAIITHCCWTIVQEGRTIKAILPIVRMIKIPNLCRLAGRAGVRQFLHFAVFLVIASVVWYITPHFICDILFYLILWHTPYHIVYTTIRKILGIQRRRLQAGLQIRIN